MTVRYLIASTVVLVVAGCFGLLHYLFGAQPEFSFAMACMTGAALALALLVALQGEDVAERHEQDIDLLQKQVRNLWEALELARTTSVGAGDLKIRHVTVKYEDGTERNICVDAADQWRSEAD